MLLRVEFIISLHFEITSVICPFSLSHTHTHTHTHITYVCIYIYINILLFFKVNNNNITSAVKYPNHHCCIVEFFLLPNM